MLKDFIINKPDMKTAKQIHDLLTNLFNHPKKDSYLARIKPNETIKTIIVNRLIRNKIKYYIGKLDNEHSRIKNIKFEKVHVDGLEEDGSDDQKLNVYYFDVNYKDKSYKFYITIERINILSNKCGCIKFANIHYNLGFSGNN